MNPFSRLLRFHRANKSYRGFYTTEFYVVVIIVLLVLMFVTGHLSLSDWSFLGLNVVFGLMFAEQWLNDRGYKECISFVCEQYQYERQYSETLEARLVSANRRRKRAERKWKHTLSLLAYESQERLNAQVISLEKYTANEIALRAILEGDEEARALFLEYMRTDPTARESVRLRMNMYLNDFINKELAKRNSCASK